MGNIPKLASCIQTTRTWLRETQSSSSKMRSLGKRRTRLVVAMPQSQKVQEYGQPRVVSKPATMAA